MWSCHAQHQYASPGAVCPGWHKDVWLIKSHCGASPTCTRGLGQQGCLAGFCSLLCQGKLAGLGAKGTVQVH